MLGNQNANVIFENPLKITARLSQFPFFPTGWNANAFPRTNPEFDFLLGVANLIISLLWPTLKIHKK